MILALLAASIAAAQPAPVSSFELSPAGSRTVLGAPFEMSGMARVPEGMRLEPLAGGTTGAFEILEVGVGPGKRAGGAQEIPVRMKVAAFELGRLVFPRRDWTLTSPGGSTSSVQSPPVPLDVEGPSCAGEGGDIRDIKGPLSPSPWPWLAALAALLAAGAFAASRLRRGQASPPAAGEPDDQRTPEEKALGELDALLGLDLAAKEFYDRLSDILRGYLSLRLGIDALQMTTHDLLRALREAPLDATDARARVKALLDRCDLAKFARFVPGDRERPDDVEKARSLVRDSAPKPPEARP
jgi:hypothetical protein